MTNTDFLKVVSASFNAFIQSGSSRSNAKLKPLHGAIAKDIATRLSTAYTVFSQGYGDGKEEKMEGRYMDKMVDIVIKRGTKTMAGVAIKFVMQNYSQNSNNYFENMLGETANIRCNNFPYFQIFIILDKLPYYDKDNNIKHWESFTEHNIDKYVALSQDNSYAFMHTPNKTLIFVVHVPDPAEELLSKREYFHYYKSHSPNLTISKNVYPDFSNSVILNNYEAFIDKVYHTVMAI